MPTTPTITEPTDIPNFSPKLYGIGLLAAGIIGIGLLLVSRFNEIDLARDLQTWQEKLNLVAESRVDDVDQWVAGNFKELRTLADNPSLQLYMTELQMMPVAAGAKEEPSQKSYLRNLLLFTAQRAGFGAAPGATAAIPANVQQGGKDGLAILGPKDDIVASTMMDEATRDLLLAHASEAAAGQEALIDIRADKEGVAYIGFVVPVYSIQGEHNAASQIGRVVGIKTLGSNLFGLLKHPGTTEQTLETVLLRANGNTLEFLSPLQDGTNALGKSIDLSPAKSAESKLLQTVGDFSHDLTDYRDKPVLATSRAVAGTPWTMVVKIDRDEALADSGQRRAGMEIAFVLIIAIIVLLVVSTWWRANSKRSMMMSTHFRRMAARSQAQEQLLRLVADNQPEPIYIVDADYVLRFANAQAVSAAQMSVDSVAGKSLRDVRGTARAAQISLQCEKALETGAVSYEIERSVHKEQEVVTRSAYVPLEHIPLISLPSPTPGVLIVEQDITEIVHEREQRLRTQRQLIETLVMLVDKRDPFSANHSRLVSQLAYEVALEMGVETVLAETTSVAGSLMNIGKIMVPTELLTKNTPLTADEKRIIHESMNEAADMLRSISFDGPVADTVRQWQEKWDGTGPFGLTGETILISARIIAVANAFIGMISPRSWRTAIPIDAASKFLLDQSGTHFDHRVVIALINFIENHNGRTWVTQVLEHKRYAS